MKTKGMRSKGETNLGTEHNEYLSPLIDDMRQLKAALMRTHQERFLFATRLYKIQQTLSKAIIVHKPDTLKK